MNLGIMFLRHLLFSPDPMNALQTLTGGPPAGAAAMGMTVRPPGAPMGGMGGLGPLGQQMSLPGQQPPGNAGMAPHGIPGISAATQQSKWWDQSGTFFHAGCFLNDLLMGKSVG